MSMSVTTHSVSAPRPDRATALDWVRTNLFGGIFNTSLTVLAIALIIAVFPPVFDWAVLSSVWGAATPEMCHQAQGACWSIIHEKYRLILFGRYPFDEQWRPLLGIVILLALVVASCNRDFWRAWLGAVWIVAIGVFAALMWGGVFGLKYVENELWGGLPLTLILAVVGCVAAFPISIFLALGRRSDMPVIRAMSVAYIEMIRGVPLISLLFMASFMFPLFLPTGVHIDALLRAQVAIIMFLAAYLAEAVRGGLQAIPAGQVEAASAIGLTYWQAMRIIILPQAIRLVIPPIVNSFISTFKDTSLVAIVSLTDLLLATRQAIADPNWRAFFVEGYVFIALIYLAFCYSISRYSQHLEIQLHTGRQQR